MIFCCCCCDKCCAYVIDDFIVCFRKIFEKIANDEGQFELEELVNVLLHNRDIRNDSSAFH